MALTGFEFTGAIRVDLEQQGYAAISCDKRLCLIGGHHFVGDARLLLSLTVWSYAVLFPPCFQQLRGDLDCIEAKIKDGRAFWGCALVVYCIVATTAVMLAVEQPDTLVHDAFDAQAWPDVRVVELRTAEYGDKDKFVRLTLRNVAPLQPPPYPGARLPALPRSQWEFDSADLRDRSRSSWEPYSNTRALLAAATPVGSEQPPAIDYVAAIALFAATWAAMGYPVPRGHLNPLALPPPAARTYQERRGPGDGRAAGRDSLVTSGGTQVYVRLRASGRSVIDLTPPTHCADSVLAPASDSDDSPFMPLANINPRLGASQQGETARPALAETGAEPAFEELSEAGDPGGKPPPPVELEAGQLLDLRKAMSSSSACSGSR